MTLSFWKYVFTFCGQVTRSGTVGPSKSFFFFLKVAGVDINNAKVFWALLSKKKSNWLQPLQPLQLLLLKRVCFPGYAGSSQERWPFPKMPNGQLVSGVQWVLDAWPLSYRQHILNFPMPLILAWLLPPGCTGKVLTEVTHPLPSLAWPNSTGTSHLCHLYACLPSRWGQLWDGAQDFFIPLSPVPPTGWCLGGAGETSVTWMNAFPNRESNHLPSSLIFFPHLG